MNKFTTFMINTIQRYKQFMVGRYGLDRFGIALIVIYMLLNGIGSMIPNPIVRWSMRGIALIILGFEIFRFLSKNPEKRLREARFIDNFLIAINWNDKMFKMRESFKHLKLRCKFIKTHRFRKCPNCGEFLRLSKKKGTRNITCPACGKKFKRHIIF